MSSETYEKKAELLGVMANANRLHVLTVLSASEVSVGPLAQSVGLSQSALSQHLAKLRELGVVKTRRDAQTIYYSLNSSKVQEVLDLLKKLYDERAELPRRIAG